jgi:hypothetical protein
MFADDDGGRAAAGFRGAGQRLRGERAVAIALGLDYAEVHTELSQLVARHYHHEGPDAERCADRGVPWVTELYLAERGWLWHPLRPRWGEPWVKLDELMPGRLIAATTAHLVALVDGAQHDTRPRTGNVWGCFLASKISTQS